MTTTSSKLLLSGVFAALLVAGIMLVPAGDACAIDGECTTFTKSGTVGPVTATSTDDCMWAEMEARSQLSPLMSGFCGRDKICENSISFGACTYQNGTYSVSATAWVQCGSFRPF